VSDYRRVLAVAAHPDDEVLGAGATLAALSARGAAVGVVILSHGESCRPPTAENLGSRATAAFRASHCLGATVLKIHDFDDCMFDAVPLLDLVRAVESHVAMFEPDVIYTHHPGDLNVDHELTFRAVLTATRPLPPTAPAIVSFEVRSGTDWGDALGLPFRPNRWEVVDEDAVRAKIAALAEYRAEIQPWPHTRSLLAIESLLRHRGAQVGAAAAEAFMVHREVVDHANANHRRSFSWVDELA
jgi:LmbE family N-acetylglucosaminyl deacetylase